MALLQGSMICASKAKLEAAGLLPSCKKQVRPRRIRSSLSLSQHRMRTLPLWLLNTHEHVTETLS